MIRFRLFATIILLSTLVLTCSVRIETISRTVAQSSMTPILPIETDDGLDPINLIFTGYAPSWWVAANMAGWSDSAYCSGLKTVNGEPYNYTLERPDPTGLPCWGPRDHVRIWDMGYTPMFGIWSIAAVHHEHTVCNLVCHHVIDGWNNAETDASLAFTNSPIVTSVSNDVLGNTGYYQGVYYNGNATVIQLKPPPNQYPVVFNESGLGNQTSWAVTLNGTTEASQRPAIVFEESDGVYPFNVSISPGLTVSPSLGTITVDSGAVQNIRFMTPWTTSTANVSQNGQTISITFAGNATVDSKTIRISTGRSTSINFTVTEIGTIGVVNVTIPRSTVPANAYSLVYVNGSVDYSEKLTSDSNNYYVYFSLPYGSHLVQIQLIQPMIPYVEYAAGAGVAASVLGVMMLTFRSKRRKAQSTKTRPTDTGQPVS